MALFNKYDAGFVNLLQDTADLGSGLMFMGFFVRL